MKYFFWLGQDAEDFHCHCGCEASARRYRHGWMRLDLWGYPMGENPYFK